ncbi:hypothetical protein [Oceanobacillus saliphilus]|uniref:hypothetical protein n=1 Tax=Oceanobacillus saliphilus TaxID=2925834 RepID=UPI00201DE77A|nr:hypothetical protein [Oceanobacillus saliphilus]
MGIIESYKVQLRDKLHMKDLLNLHQIASNSSSSIYLYRNHMIADAENLPKLLSFFLTIKNDEIFTLLNDVPPEENPAKIMDFLDHESLNVLLKVDYQASDNESIVI